MAAAINHPNATAGRSVKAAVHHRNNSDELDVFEAASYFSGYGEAATEGLSRGTAGARTPNADSQKVLPRRVTRMSLDEPSRHPIVRQSQNTEFWKDKVAQKQPSSPGGKLASFLNSIFNQTSKKKSKSSKGGNGEEKGGQGGRRKRRSSISHFAASTTDSMTVSDSNSIYASSFNSACKPYAVRSHTSLKDSGYYANRYSHVVSLPSLPLTGSGLFCKGTRGSNHSQPEKGGSKCQEKGVSFKWPGNKCVASDERNYRKFANHDDGADSDSSSDLFELQNYDIGMKIYPTGVPVYDATHIKIAAPITNTVSG